MLKECENAPQDKANDNTGAILFDDTKPIGTTADWSVQRLDKEKAAGKDLANAAAILLGEVTLTGSDGANLRTAYEAEQTMGKALGWFANKGFEKVDSDKNGLLTSLEISKAREANPIGVKPEVLKFLQKKVSILPAYCRDSSEGFDFDVSKQDIRSYTTAAGDRYNDNLSQGFVKALQKDDLRAIESVVFELGKRKDKVDRILSSAEISLPGGSFRHELEFEASTNSKNGATTVTIKNGSLGRLHVSTDPAVRSITERNSNKLWGETWVPTKTSAEQKSVLSNIGTDARKHGSFELRLR
ncbi:MAG: hypothetical protein SGJ27_30620 [Candidatus Melainabacteria bacterium]|nr:hypothetical protein [Candidatus Melainabacteria bacterium]